MFLLSVILAALIAVLSGMGVGGGGLLVIWLVLVIGMPSPAAQGINLLFFVVSALSALPVHLRLRTLPTGLLLLLTTAAIPGVFIGCHLATLLSADNTRRIFGYFLLLTGGLQLYRGLRCHFSLDYQNKS